MSTSMLTSFADLLALLTEHKIPYAVDQEQQVVETPIKAPPLEGSMFLRWEKDLPYLQLICIMLRDVPADRAREIESACCRANTAIALPGFGIDHARSCVYFRLTLPTVDGLAANTVQRMVMAVASNSRDFVVAFQQIARGGQPGESIIDLAVAWSKEDAAARQAAQTTAASPA